MKTLIDSRQFNRLKQLDRIFAERLIPYEWKLKYSSTEGYVIVVHDNVSNDFQTIALCPLNADFNIMADMIEDQINSKNQ